MVTETLGKLEQNTSAFFKLICFPCAQEHDIPPCFFLSFFIYLKTNHGFNSIFSPGLCELPAGCLR